VVYRSFFGKLACRCLCLQSRNCRVFACFIMCSLSEARSLPHKKVWITQIADLRPDIAALHAFFPLFFLSFGLFFKRLIDWIWLIGLWVQFFHFRESRVSGLSELRWQARLQSARSLRWKKLWTKETAKFLFFGSHAPHVVHVVHAAHTFLVDNEHEWWCSHLLRH